jgi:hypothetical protein
MIFNVNIHMQLNESFKIGLFGKIVPIQLYLTHYLKIDYVKVMV